MIYFGECSKILDHYQSVGLICKPQYNPADFISRSIVLSYLIFIHKLMRLNIFHMFLLIQQQMHCNLPCKLLNLSYLSRFRSLFLIPNMFHLFKMKWKNFGRMQQTNNFLSKRANPSGFNKFIFKIFIKICFLSTVLFILSSVTETFH